MSGDEVIQRIARQFSPIKRAQLSIGVLVSGNGSNLQALIDFSQHRESYFKVDSVITNNPSSLALKKAQEAGITHHLADHRKFSSKTAFEQQLLSHLVEDGIELVVLAGFMRVLSTFFLNHFDQRVINLHPSLLPQHRGLNAIEKAVLANDTHTGCTVHLVDDGLDTGPIIAQSACPIFEDDDLAKVTERIRALEHALLPQVVNLIAKIVLTRDLA
jgi:formyltetrahydrofolate-dependent phosphoribosylglycinamide formyltransferase